MDTPRPDPQTSPETGAAAAAPLVTAAQLAALLGVSPKAIKKRLASAPARKVAAGHGQTANAWPLDVLPEDWNGQLQATATRKGFASAEALLQDTGAVAWQPPVAFGSLARRYQEEAKNWRSALWPGLEKQHQIPPGELLRDGLAESSRVFGRAISESTWRRHFDLAVARDRGFQKWARLDLYVPEAAYERQPSPSSAPLRCSPEHLQDLMDFCKQVADPSKLTIEESAWIWKAILDSQAPRASVLDEAFRALPGLARTRKGLQEAFRRKRRDYKKSGGDISSITDKRKGNSGRPTRRLCAECEPKVTEKMAGFDGDRAHGWRQCHLDGILCPKCARLWKFDVRSNKSYVPQAVLKQIDPGVKRAVDPRRGATTAAQNGPYILCRPNIGPGDVFEGDDVTLNHEFWAWDTDAKGKVYVGRGEWLLFIDRRTQYPLAYVLKIGAVDSEGKQISARYNGLDIRLGVLRVHDRIGLPRKGFLFENGIWRSRLVVGDPMRRWRLNPWAEYESGLHQEGIILRAAGEDRAVRHALPRNAKAKLIERVFGTLQERMRPHPGFVGFNHREYNPETVNRYLREIRSGKLEAAQVFYSLRQIRDVVDAELMQFAREPQNGRWLPGVSPEEAWLGGIGGFPGIKANPLRQLSQSARYLLSTHYRELPVSGKGIVFRVGEQHFVFWGDELRAWKHRKIPTRWNIEEPDLLHCLPPGGTPFTVKLCEIDFWDAPEEKKSELIAARRRWLGDDRRFYDNLPHVLISTVVNDTEHSEETHRTGEAIERDTEIHRGEKEQNVREQKRLKALGGALNLTPGKGERLTAEAVDARKRLDEMYQANPEENL